MALFAVIALKDYASAIDTAITDKFSNTSYQVEQGKWIVNADVTTAKELGASLGLDSTWHLILQVRGYYGFAQPDIWEWLAAQTMKKDA